VTHTDQIRAAYDASGEAWGAGPARVYRALAQPVLDALGAVAGALVLDVGTGTGVLADELVRRGARVVGADLSHGMLRRGAESRPPALVADVRALPLVAASVDVVTAAFVLNHLDRPVVGLRELRRVLRPAGPLLATTFEGDAPHPAKQLLEDVALAHGYVAPAWYQEVKGSSLPLLSTPELFATAATEAGLGAVRVDTVDVSLTLSPAELVGWRFGMAQLAPFVSSLTSAARQELVAAGERAVADVVEPVGMPVLLLTARA